MAVINVSVARVKDEAAFDAYLRAAAELMQGFDIEVVARGSFLETLSGEAPAGHVMAVFRYPDMKVARSFFASQGYQALIPLRDRACEMTIHLYEEASPAASVAQTT